MEAVREPRVDLDVRRVLGDTYTVYRELFLHTFALGLLVFGVLGMLRIVVASGHARQLGPLVVAAFAAAGTALVQGVFVDVVRAAHENEDGPSPEQLWRRVTPRIPTLTRVSALLAVCIGLGLILGVVPGLLYGTWGAVAVPIVMAEGEPSARAALKRSRRLVRGHTRAVFRALLNVWAIVLIVQFGLGFFASRMLGPGYLAAWIGSTLGAALMTPYLAHAQTVVYFRLIDPGRPLLNS